jgi:hypothetical protein
VFLNFLFSFVLVFVTCIFCGFLLFFERRLFFDCDELRFLLIVDVVGRLVVAVFTRNGR